MTTLFITHKYPPSVGGMEKQSFELIQGYQVIQPCQMIAYDGSTSIVQFFLALKTKVKECLLAHPDIAIIHLNDGLMAAVFWLLGIKTDKKIVVTFHGLDVVFPFWAYQKYILPRVRKFDAFVCVSNATKQECLNRGFAENKLFVVVNGVDTNPAYGFDSETMTSMFEKKYQLNFTKDKILIGIGRPVKRKGFSWFAREVLPLLPNNYKYIHIGKVQVSESKLSKLLPKRVKKMIELFLGSTNDSGNLIELSKNQQPKNQLILAGRISDDERDFLISVADLIIMPNIKDPGDMEGFGLVALEASIQGKKVLAAGIEGITDAVHHNKNGYLTQSEDANAWKDAIMELTQTSVKYSDEIKQYTINHYSWSKMVAGYVKIFNQILR